MNKINYQKILDKEIEKIQKEKEKKTLLLHSCCAPCSSYVLEYLSKYFEITDLYYNPNIFPEEEYIYRSNELRRLIDEMPAKIPVKYISCEYTPEDFNEIAKGREKEKEGGERCFLCYRLRLEKTAQIAMENNFDYFTTTLSISP